MLACVVEERLILAEGGFHNLFNARILKASAFQELITRRDVSIVMLVMMEFEGFARHIFAKRVVSVRKFRQRE